MRLTLAAVGRAKPGPLSQLYADYSTRFARGPWGPLQLREVEERRPLPAQQMKQREGELLMAALPDKAYVMALDERGKSLTSRDFAQLLGRLADEGRGEVAFVIGGANGLSESLRQRADLLLSLGAMTWPHMLVRSLLAEQLWRAETILSGHPYHRE